MNKTYLLGSEIPIFSVSQPMLNLNIFGDDTLVWINELGLMTELVEHFPGFSMQKQWCFYHPKAPRFTCFPIGSLQSFESGGGFSSKFANALQIPTNVMDSMLVFIHLRWNTLGLIACQVISYQGCVAMEYAAKLQVGLGKPPRIFTWPLTKTSGQKKNWCGWCSFFHFGDMLRLFRCFASTVGTWYDTSSSFGHERNEFHDGTHMPEIFWDCSDAWFSINHFGSRSFNKWYVILRFVSDFRGLLLQYSHARSAFCSDWWISCCFWTWGIGRCLS